MRWRSKSAGDPSEHYLSAGTGSDDRLPIWLEASVPVSHDSYGETLFCQNLGLADDFLGVSEGENRSDRMDLPANTANSEIQQGLLRDLTSSQKIIHLIFDNFYG